MRVLSAIALLVIGLCAARAADYPAAYGAGYFESGQRAAMLWLCDDQPGVVVRAYWRAPWHHHHYFPATGRRPGIGRVENLSAHRRPPALAKTFRRGWSNAAALALEYRIHAAPRDDGPSPRPRQPPQNPD